MNRQEALVGLDIGTTRCKALLVNLEGTTLASAISEYPINTPHPGWAEQDPMLVYRAALSVIRKVCQEVKDIDILGIGLSVQGEAVIPLDAKGRPLRAAILGMDIRPVEENKILYQHFGTSLYENTGMPIHTVNTLPKLLWIKRHEPKVWAETRRFVLYEDFFALYLSGFPAISKCLASRTQMYDIRQQLWFSEVLDFLELSKDKLSTLAPSGTPVGKILKSVRKTLRIKSNPEVVLGGHDQACAAFGAGVIEPGASLISTGTAEVILSVTERPLITHEMATSNISCYHHVVPDRYLIMTLNHCGGIVLQWFRDNFCLEEIKKAKRIGRDAYEIILADLPMEPSQLLTFPYFSGSGSPWPDPAARAGIVGIGLLTTKKHFVKSLLEGLCYELRLNIDFLKSIGLTTFSTFITVGGGAKSAVWNQIKADILGFPIKVPVHLDSAPLGAAFLAGLGVGVFSSYDQIRSWIKIDREFIPSKENIDLYNKFYEAYKKMRPTVIKMTKNLLFC